MILIIILRCQLFSILGDFTNKIVILLLPTPETELEVSRVSGTAMNREDGLQLQLAMREKRQFSQVSRIFS
jgi:hypothetical protein